MHVDSDSGKFVFDSQDQEDYVSLLVALGEDVYPWTIKTCPCGTDVVDICDLHGGDIEEFVESDIAQTIGDALWGDDPLAKALAVLDPYWATVLYCPDCHVHHPKDAPLKARYGFTRTFLSFDATGDRVVKYVHTETSREMRMSEIIDIPKSWEARQLIFRIEPGSDSEEILITSDNQVEDYTNVDETFSELMKDI